MDKQEDQHEACYTTNPTKEDTYSRNRMHVIRLFWTRDTLFSKYDQEDLIAIAEL